MNILTFVLLVCICGIGYVICWVVSAICLDLKRRRRFNAIKSMIPITRETNLSYIKNYIAYMDGKLQRCDLNGYISFLEIMYQKYIEANLHESFAEFLNRLCKPLNEDEDEETKR